MKDKSLAHHAGGRDIDLSGVPVGMFRQQVIV